MGKILVAEDSLIVNQHIMMALKSGGHEPIAVYSGKEAVQAAKTHEPELILMDIMMESPSDGIEAAIEIKNTLDIPVIFLTALTDDPTIQKAKISLPYGYVVKPFNEAELLSNIDVSLYKARAEKKIKENSELFGAIINAIDKAVFLLDADKKIKYTNAIGEAFTQQPFEQLINKPIQDFLVFTDLYQAKLYHVFDETPAADQVLTLPHSNLIFGDFYSQRVFLDDEYQLFIFKDVTDRFRIKEANEILKNKRLSFFIEGQEKERERIARDLHDGVGQIANMVKLALKKGDSDEMVLDLVDQFLEEMRKVTDGLLPSRLIDFPLDVSLRKIVEQADNASKIGLRFISEDIPELDLNHKVNIYRIVQENLSNIIKHSKAKKATIQLFGYQDHLQLTIEDDGVGFEVGSYQDNESHHGLQNIMFRAEVLKGTLEIESNQRNGTFISLKIPLNK